MQMEVGNSIAKKDILHRLTSLLKTIGVTRVANITGLDNIGVPVVSCIRPNAKHLSVSQGKGLTMELALISGMMESVEGYHIENPRAPDFLGSYQNLRDRHSLIHPDYFRKGFIQCDLGSREIAWIKAFDLVSEQSIYIPYDAVWIDSSLPRKNSALFNASTNGVGAGGSISDAILHAVFEIIERDALYQWHKMSDNERAKTQVKTESIDSDTNKRLIEKIVKSRQKISIWQLISSVRCPVFFCSIENMDYTRNLGVFHGSGAHIEKEVALTRAILEAVQARLTFISGVREEIFPRYYNQSELYSKNQVNDQPTCDWMRSDNFNTVKRVDYLDNVINAITQAGYSKIIVLDHTKPDLDIPVVHVFIPGMREDLF